MIPRILISIVLAFLATGPLYSPAPAENAPITLPGLARLMAALSEPEGYFDSDNFVSNEAAYLRIVPLLRRRSIQGGAYLGVGPDQNYSYIAEICPDIAFIIDIRRQNALQHLYYKALFQLSATRIEYLERLFGRPVAARAASFEAPITDLLRRIDEAPRDADFAQVKLAQAVELIDSWRIGLTGEDLRAIRYIGGAFVSGGPDLQFTSYNRAPRPHHPSYRRLLIETDGEGRNCNYLADEERFRTLKRLHRYNRIIPIVGDLAGTEALQRSGEEIRRRGLQITCFYVSNVEFYLFRGERWEGYVRNLRSLPWDDDACIIRSYANMWQPHPAQEPGYYMSTMMQRVRDFLANESAGRNGTYWDVVTRDCIFK